MAAKYDISVAIIFKNEIRCLERCLKSLQPLKERLSVEIVMADTGSNDGSRKVAEKYADILFDFPWINDFSAARNAVIERCTGRWIMILDADEWLSDDIAPLVNAVGEKRIPSKFNAIAMSARNYNTVELTSYSEFFPSKLFRASAGLHYVGAIHEQPVFNGGEELKSVVINGTYLHHDGYVMLNNGSASGRRKVRRNLELIRESLAEDPDNVRSLLHFIDSGRNESDYMEKLLHAINLIERKQGEWAEYGPHILRNAISSALEKNLPVFQQWVALAEERFSKSYLITVDVASFRMQYAMQHDDLAEGVRLGEQYLRNWRKYRADPNPTVSTKNAMLSRGSVYDMNQVLMKIIAACIRMGDYDHAYLRLRDVEWTGLQSDQVHDILMAIAQLYYKSDLAVDVLMRAFWDGINIEKPDKDAAKLRRETFLESGRTLFDAKTFTEDELQIDTGDKELWRLFTALEGICSLGDTAALMRNDTAEDMEKCLTEIDNLATLPSRAFTRAIMLGCRFPLPARKLYSEEMDALALKLKWDPTALISLALHAVDTLPPYGTPEYGQTLLWNRAIVLVAVRGLVWENSEDGIALARAFSDVERLFLPYSYTPAALDELCALPSMHRFGVFCVRAFDALDQHNYADCLHALREGLKHCGDMRPMVEYLLDSVKKQEREARIESAPPELRKMAEQLKTMLASYPVDDPAVQELKKTEQYQKLAYLIEG